MRVQSPDISTALRKALALSGSGSFPMEVDSSIVPVVLVADTRSQADQRYDDCVGYASAQLAAQYARVALGWANPTPRTRLIELRAITLYSDSTMPVYLGWGSPQPVGGSVAKLKQQHPPAGAPTQSIAGRVTFDTSLVAPTIAEYGIVVATTVNTTQRLSFVDDPWVFREPATAFMPNFVVHGGAVGASLAVSFEWREWLNQ